MAKTIEKKPAASPLAQVSTFKIGSKTFTFTQEEKICGILMVLLVLLIAVIRAKFLNIPYERDEGAYSYYGKMLLAGKTPYKDFYEQKLPGIFYFYALMVSIFGSSVKEMHTGFIFLNIISTILLYFSAKKMFTPIAGVITATTFALVSMSPFLSGFTIQGEHGVAFFICLGIFMYTRARATEKWYWYILMGFALGAAFMVKTSGLFLMFWGGFILLTDFFFSKEKKVYKKLFTQVFLYCAGAFGIVGVLLLVILIKGSFNEMIYWVVQMPKYYVSRITYAEGMKYFGFSRDAIVMNYKFFWINSILALALCLIKSIDWKTKIFIFSLAALSFLTIVPGFYFYGHYWIQLVPGMAMLAGATYYCVMQLLKQFNFTTPSIKYAYLGVFAVLVFMHLNKQRSYYFSPNYDLILRQVYGNNPFPETMQIANYLNSIAKPQDDIAVFGSEPEMFIYTNKTSPTRHIFFSTIVAAIPEHKQFQREFVSDVEKAKPKYFVFYRHSVSLLVQPNTDQYVFEWANKYLTEHYKVIGVVEMPPNQLMSTYVYGKEAETFQPQAQDVIYIFERKG